jgi:hypothetical protein
MVNQEILAKLDPVAVTRYQITEKDLRTIEKYKIFVDYPEKPCRGLNLAGDY